jgi:hypothetical protein
MLINAETFKIDSSDTSYDRYYTVSGSESFLDNDGFPRTETETPLTFAKAIKNKKSKDLKNSGMQYRYYILVDENNNIINPVTIHSLPEHNNAIGKHTNKICKANRAFKEVTLQIFNQYIFFLKTKSKKFLAGAQREIQ